ncbi:hypothetical protein H1R16_02595 [Marnyiella aurantia]|uniref:Uncharacterized protein n=1 Tax=Marnyiella aurantia TaxID=2758037 RepID=A0A7D7LU25_9FLAO|nr:DUF6428 family protein [Marnyiella aurantia]MBA5245677.1 hypothetical protein [Marnyiella aurantia]QMS98915.1 hypothetical protein H1R16_02595 [Marnyiella aurantia]
MKLSEIKTILDTLPELHFVLENGEQVPDHFHVTEVGQISKKFIDCGGTIRDEKAVNFQLWYSTDNDHRLEAEKLKKIIALSEDKLGLEDAEIEVEYQQGTIGKFGLNFNGREFVLTATSTACLAEDSCGVPQPKTKMKLSELQSASCAPGSGCC